MLRSFHLSHSSSVEPFGRRRAFSLLSAPCPTRSHIICLLTSLSFSLLLSLSERAVAALARASMGGFSVVGEWTNALSAPAAEIKRTDHFLLSPHRNATSSTIRPSLCPAPLFLSFFLLLLFRRYRPARRIERSPAKPTVAGPPAEPAGRSAFARSKTVL